MENPYYINKTSQPYVNQLSQSSQQFPQKNSQFNDLPSQRSLAKPLIKNEKQKKEKKKEKKNKNKDKKKDKSSSSSSSDSSSSSSQSKDKSKKEKSFINIPSMGNSQTQKQQPAFVRYSSPVVIPHVDSQYKVVIEKPIKVIDVEKFEEMWNKKMKQIDELFNDKLTIQTKDQDNSQNLELRGGRRSSSSSSSSSSSDKDKDNEEIYKLQIIIGEKDKEIYQANQLIEILQKEKQEYYLRFETMTQEIKTLQTVNTFEVECQLWKKKFAELSDTFHACQEKLMMKEAESESFQTITQKQLKDKDAIIYKLQQELEELTITTNELKEEYITLTTAKTYEAEYKIWKKKFENLNDTYHACKEELDRLQVEHEILKKKPSQQQIITTSIYQTNSSKVIKNEAESLKTSQTSKELEIAQSKLKTIQFQ